MNPFNGAHLEGAHLGEVHLQGTVLVQTDLTGARLWGTDLSGALGLTREQLKVAAIDLSKARLPANLATSTA